MNSSNELKKKFAQESKSRNLMSFFHLLRVALVSQSKITEEEMISDEEEGDESEKENEYRECKETGVTSELWVQCDNSQKR